MLKDAAVAAASVLRLTNMINLFVVVIAESWLAGQRRLNGWLEN
jgi:hypothetical protein